jgi:hypothetical protein
MRGMRSEVFHPGACLVMAVLTATIIYADGIVPALLFFGIGLGSILLDLIRRRRVE